MQQTEERQANTEIEEENARRAKKTGPAVVYMIGLFTAVVSGTVFLAFGLFFMEFGGELCSKSPSGNILSNPNWSCSLRPQMAITGIGLFGLYSLPYGLTVAWIGDRWRIFGNLGFPRSHEREGRPVILIFFPLMAGAVGAAILFAVLQVMFVLFGLPLIPIMTFASAVLGILIFIDYSRRKVPSGH